MFDILLYLYDTYLYSEQFPPSENLQRKLSAAGFEDADIGAALDWLEALDDLTAGDEEAMPCTLRCYSDDEMSRLNVEGRGFLLFLENSGLLSMPVREWVIEQAMALDDTEVSAERIKWIALLALWKRGGIEDVLWLEDLVRGRADPIADSGEEGWQPTFH